MLATITRPWIGRRSRLDGPRRQRGGCRRAVVGQGRARHRVLGGALAGRTVPACSSSCSGGWTSSNAQGGAPPGPGSRAAATPVTGAADPPTPNLTGKLPVSVAALAARPGVGRAVSVRQVKARSWGWRVAASTVTGPKDGQRRAVIPDRPPVRNAGKRTSATFHLDPWPGAGPGAWSAASGPPGGRSAAQDQLGGPGILASSQVSLARPGVAVPAAARSACSGWPGRPSRSDMRGPRGCPTPGHHRGDRGNLAVQRPVDTADVATVSRPILQQSAAGDAASISSSL
jgi:hypothetical protein